MVSLCEDGPFQSIGFIMFRDRFVSQAQNFVQIMTEWIN